MKQDIFVSVAVIASIRNQSISETLVRVEGALRAAYEHYEVLVIDSDDRNVDAAQLDTTLKTIRNVRAIHLFGNPSTQVMTAAGLENAIGDVIVVSEGAWLNAENIVQSVSLCCKGNDVVCGLSKIRTSLLSRINRALFVGVFGRMIGYDKLPSHDVGFRCVSRRALNAALLKPRFHQFVFLRLATAVEKQVMYNLAGTENGQSRPKPVNSGLPRAIDLVIFNTIRPLRIMNALAVVSSFFCVLIALYSLVVRLFVAHVVEGWTTIILVLSWMFLMLFLLLAFIGEYLARMLDTNSAAHPYGVVSERHSSVMVDLNELNVKENGEACAINLTQTGRDR